MQMMMSAWTAQTISAVTRLDVPDILQAHGPLTARQLTESHGVDARPELLERALRACASVAVFTEGADGRFGPTPLSATLTLGSPVSVKRFVELIGGRWWTTFAGLPEALRQGQPRPVTRSVETPPPDPMHTQRFAEAMKSRVESTRGVLEHGDFSRARTVVDVGGGRILCVDKVLPPMGDTSASSAKLLDMLMLVSLPGKERTEAEWRALYAEAGLRVASITRIEARSGESIVEGVRD
ncbi:MAG: methyltransferase family protein [Candidatus Rokuibacteriota bacterium]